jgi:hypothetical protein
MAVFANGHEKLGGRKPGTPNKGTQSIRALLSAELPGDELRKLWHKYLYHKNLAVAFEAFKLANQYMFGRPAASPINDEDAPQHTGPHIVDNLPHHHVPYVPATEE